MALPFRRLASCAFLPALLVLAGCGEKPLAPKGQTFVTEVAPIEFLFPEDWKPNSSTHPYDLQCFSGQEDMTTGVFVFTADLVPDELTADDVFAIQIEDLESKRTNFTVLDRTSHEDEIRSVRTVSYSGEKDGSQNIYRFSLVRFAEDPDVFAVVLQTCIPEIHEAQKGLLAGIIHSARLQAGPGGS